VTKKDIKMARFAAHITLAGAVAAFAADLTLCYGMVFVVGWDWQNPTENIVLWLLPILVLTAIAGGGYWLYEQLSFYADKAARRMVRNWRA